MPHYKPGRWKYECPVCGFDVYSTEVRQRWDGKYVCHDCWEPRHPQELKRIPRERGGLPFSNNPDTPSYVMDLGSE